MKSSSTKAKGRLKGRQQNPDTQQHKIDHVSI